MAMRETVGSLRAYFIVAALLSGVRGVLALLAEPIGLGAIPSIVVILFAAVYLYVGLRLKTLLTKAPAQVLGIVLTGGGLIGIFLFASILVGSAFGVGMAVVELLIVWYLYANTRRLAAEAHAAPRPLR